MDKPRYYGDKDATEDNTILSMHPASTQSVETVSKASETSGDGRSNWFWVRLHNGDLILGCFPQGETYMALEADAQYP